MGRYQIAVFKMIYEFSQQIEAPTAFNSFGHGNAHMRHKLGCRWLNDTKPIQEQAVFVIVCINWMKL